VKRKIKTARPRKALDERGENANIPSKRLARGNAIGFERVSCRDECVALLRSGDKRMQLDLDFDDEESRGVSQDPKRAHTLPDVRDTDWRDDLCLCPRDTERRKRQCDAGQYGATGAGVGGGTSEAKQLESPRTADWKWQMRMFRGFVQRLRAIWHKPVGYILKRGRLVAGLGIIACNTLISLAASADVVADQTLKEPDIEIPEKIRTSVAIVEGQTYKYLGKYSSVVKIEKFVDSEDFNSPIVLGDNRKAGGPCAIIEAFVNGAGYGKMKFCSATYWKVVQVDGRISEQKYLNIFYESEFLREKCDTFDLCAQPPLSLFAISPPVCRRISYYEFVGNQGTHLRLIAPSNMSNANSTEKLYRAGIVKKDRKAMMRLCKSVDRRKV
jgi:hypothetical protein